MDRRGFIKGLVIGGSMMGQTPTALIQLASDEEVAAVQNKPAMVPTDPLVGGLAGQEGDILFVNRSGTFVAVGVLLGYHHEVYEDTRLGATMKHMSQRTIGYFSPSGPANIRVSASGNFSL